MTVKLHNLNKFPEGFSYASSYDLDLLNDYAVEDLDMLGLEEVWYWYGNGGYEGVGADSLHQRR